MVVVAAGIVLIPRAPRLGDQAEPVQALAGLLLPSASVFLLLLCNDRQVLAPWVNPPWLNAAATVIIAVLLMLPGILMATTLFPHLNPTHIVIWVSAGLVTGFAAAGLALRLARSRARGATVGAGPPLPRELRAGWRMPSLALLKPVTWSPALRLGMLALRVYLLVAALLLLVKATQVGTH